MAQLVSAFADLLIFMQQTVQGSDGAEIAAFVEQGGVDFGRSLVGEAGFVQ